LCACPASPGATLVAQSIDGYFASTPLWTIVGSSGRHRPLRELTATAIEVEPRGRGHRIRSRALCFVEHRYYALNFSGGRLVSTVFGSSRVGAGRSWA